MIVCPVCQTENDQYAVVCRSCRGFLQNKIPNLDLFETAWLVLEKPRTAFQRIVTAEHKNYTLLLFSLFGIAFAFAELWFFRAGNRFDSFFSLLMTSLFAGLASGLVLFFIIPFIHWGISKILYRKAGFRNSLGITAYSLVPIIISIFFILPIELLTFGVYFFTFNPDPMTINASSYVILLVLDGLMGLWSIMLCLMGTKIGHQMNWLQSCIVVLCVLAVLTACGYAAGHFMMLMPVVL
ncbi:MAG TPA: Yip1 family protein [Bacteroidota bacterium]|nr:Yip1 family protein [Bacteroidota bacterium]